MKSKNQVVDNSVGIEREQIYHCCLTWASSIPLPVSPNLQCLLYNDSNCSSARQSLSSQDHRSNRHPRRRSPCRSHQGLIGRRGPLHVFTHNADHSFIDARKVRFNIARQRGNPRWGAGGRRSDSVNDAAGGICVKEVGVCGF